MSTARTPHDSVRWLLYAGLAVPVLYFGIILVAAATWPGYSHVTQYVSELGSADAPHPWLFNAGILAAGVAALVAAVGMVRPFLAEGRPWTGGLASLALAAWGVGMLTSGAGTARRPRAPFVPARVPVPRRRGRLV
jgi:hypothetical membrane protein